MIRQLLEITFVMIVIYLVLSNARGFAQSVGAVGQIYISAIKALQGR